MGTKITIGNRTTAIPDVYGQIKSGIINPPTAIDFGNVVIIDDGSFGSSNYIAANGVNGENKQGLDSFLEFTEYSQVPSVIWDSELLTIMKSLFKPTRRQGSLGANKVTYIQAATTTAAISTFLFSKGILNLKTKPEGESLNGKYITKTYTVSGTTPALATPTGLSIGSYNQYGSLAAGPYFYKIVALNQYGTTVGSTEVTATITGNTGYIYLYWNSVVGATSYRIYRGTVTNTQTLYFVSNGPNFSDDGTFTGTNGTVPSTNTTSSGNGAAIPTSQELAQGFAMKLEVGRSFGYSLAFYKGNHNRMEDPLNPGFGFNESALPDITQGALVGTYNIVKPSLMFRSPDVRRLSELKRWMEKSPDFKRWYDISNFSFDVNDDLIVSGDLATQTAQAPYKLFASATTVFNADDFTNALNLTNGLDNTFYLALKGGAEGDGTNNTQIFTLLTSGEMKWDKYAFVPGYTDASNYLGSLDTTEALAKYFNNQHMIVTHGLSKVANPNYPTGFRNISVLEKTAKLLGRTAGLPPQTPLTFKDIAIDAEIHKLSVADKEAGIEAGILLTAYDSELSAFTVVAGINTLGDNDFLVNEDATSYDIGVERIKAQLNKELVYNAKRTFFGTDEGPNRATVTTEDLRTWTYGFLKSKLGGLIVRVGEISVRVEQDNYYVDYEFVPNYPVNKIIFTGIMLSA